MKSDTKSPVFGPADITSLYDALMETIEPDLTTEMIPYLDELYPDETPEETRLRAERYQRAFTLFEERFGAMIGTWLNELQDLKKSILRSIRVEEAAEQDDALSSLEQSLSNAP